MESWLMEVQDERDLVGAVGTDTHLNVLAAEEGWKAITRSRKKGKCVY